MKSALIVFVGLLALSLADPNLDAEWEDFKQRYGKTYATDNEESQRRAAFEANFNAIEAHNLEATNGQHTFTVGLNKYMDQAEDEINTVMNGLKFDSSLPKTGMKFHSDVDLADLPTKVDWRKEGYVSHIKDQKACGSCWAFSATGSLEGQHFKSEGKLVSLSEQQLVDCDKVDLGCFGGLMDHAFDYIKQNKGDDTESSYPYQGIEGPKCLFKAKDVGATVSGHVDIPTGSEADLMKAVANVGPISVGIDASHMSFHSYKDGIYFEEECSSELLDHGVLVVGYGTEDGNDYWLVKNSWGTTWGMDGYIKMARNKDNNCGIATSASYPSV
ncbi:hypothetical protein TCAL_06164 [Tigriopus californicus]|uniref:Cathepsin L n=1 Tax=Tigriopus californicus TaxID=6832 RepID=A0A553PJN9_TIGCA|nr:procathepsin L-like [Tigriopus californicus]TRY77892.1 hypothetical protein TCAL_06164 [Tigriopus californicus]|eukprot:TCALIF_06164-PA protein Name:"Similar to CTSL Cathepsin L1 (Sus scrofa)" AED:0.11 eAED:0.11 QI:45/1/1/1/1/1/3/101/329